MIRRLTSSTVVHRMWDAADREERDIMMRAFLRAGLAYLCRLGSCEYPNRESDPRCTQCGTSRFPTAPGVDPKVEAELRAAARVNGK